MSFTSEKRIAVIGLGYVGLPLATAFAKQFSTIGFDISSERVQQLKKQVDMNGEVYKEELIDLVEQLSFTDQVEDLESCNVYILTVPTPVDTHHQPDLSPLISACEMIGPLMNSGDIVIVESTVYPGACEEVCVPVLEQCSGLLFNQGFFMGYSPERMNPGDKARSVEKIIKVTSGSTPEVAQFVDELYGRIIEAGTHLASSMKVAEAAKVIENTQRDLNIALINELAIIFNKLKIDTQEVLEAAGTKWNFLKFTPGLVGGHCIGVDPYYLTHKAQEIGYHPEVILAGRRINDRMGCYVVSQVVKKMLERQIHIQGSKALILGFTFKENCSDYRNTRVIDMVAELEEYGVEVSVYDPLINFQKATEEFEVSFVAKLEENHYDAIILAVAHDAFKELSVESIRRYGKQQHILYDVKHCLPAESVDGRL